MGINNRYYSMLLNCFKKQSGSTRTIFFLVPAFKTSQRDPWRRTLGLYPRAFLKLREIRIREESRCGLAETVHSEKESD